MEIGSFLELDLRDTGEYRKGGYNVARLNTGRSGVLHALRLMNISTIYMPYYLCPTVKNFLGENGIERIPYFLTNNFEPILSGNGRSTSVLIVNYFGIFSHNMIADLSRRFNNVIIDNCPAFFNNPVENCYNIYSARKFFGVADGSYVIGPDASEGISDYPKDISSDTSAFLLKRIEKGSSAVFSERMENENRLDRSGILAMSDLTIRILRSVNYKNILKKRKENFNYTVNLFREFNLLDPGKFMDQECVPLVYPLVVEDKDLVNKLKENKIYTGRWWNHVLKEVPENSFEAHLSKFMVPIPIDQRYGRKEIDYIFNIFKKICTLY